MQCVRVKSGNDGSGDPKWEGGDNHRFTTPSNGTAAVSVVVEWGGEIETEAASAGAAAAPPQQQQSYQEEWGREERRRRGDGGSSSSDEGGTVGSVTSSTDDSMALLPQWQGKELRFMQSNEHSRWGAGGVGRGRGGGAWLHEHAPSCPFFPHPVARTTHARLNLPRDPSQHSAPCHGGICQRMRGTAPSCL